MWFGQRIGRPVGGQAVEALEVRCATARRRRARRPLATRSCSLPAPRSSTGRRHVRVPRGTCTPTCDRLSRRGRDAATRSTPSSAAASTTPSPAAAASSIAASAPGVSRSSSSALADLVERARRRAGRPAPPASGRAGRRRAACSSSSHSHAVAVVVLDDRQADRPRVPLLAQLGRRTRGCRGSSTSSRRPCAPSPRASSGARTARRWPPRDCARSHSWWGKIRSVPPPWRSIVRAELAQRQRRALDVPARAGPGPTASPTTARRRPTAARARSRAGRACSGRRRCRPARAA